MHKNNHEILDNHTENSKTCPKLLTYKVRDSIILL